MGVYEAFLDYLRPMTFKFADKKIIIWGAGKIGRIAYSVLMELGLDCYCFVDSDDNKTNTHMLGKNVLHPRILLENKNAFVIAATVYDREIEGRLRGMGLNKESYLLLCSEMEARKPENQLVANYLSDGKALHFPQRPAMPYLGSRYLNDGMFVAQIDGSQARARQRIYDRLTSGKTVIEETACPCGGKEFLLLSEKERYGLPVKIVICKQCGIIFQNPRMSGEEFGEFYTKDFSDITFNSNAVSPEDYFFWRKKDGPPAIHECIKDILDENSHILEVGCGAGGILDFFRGMGCHVTGIDLDENYITYGRSQGLDLYCCNTEEFVKNDGRKFDIVILAHVLEHFLDIEKELSVIKKLLKPQGLLYVELPGIKGFSLGAHQFDFLNSLQLAHTYYFDRDTFVQMMAWYGFRCVKSNEYISSLFQVNEDCTKPRENYCEDLLHFLSHLESHRKSLQKGIYQEEARMGRRE